jgi:DNA repair protein RecO (recombination protein O)
MKINDYDKRLVILTKENGKLAAFAKGALKPNSQYVAGSQSFAFGEFVLYGGKDSFNITQMSITEYFSELSEDLEAAYMAMYFCEFMTYITNENSDEKEQLKLLYSALKALVKKNISLNLIRYIFEYKALTNLGVAPQCFECTKCGKETVKSYSSINSGMYCLDCAKSEKIDQVLHDSTIYALQFIASTSSEKVFSFTVNEQVEYELKYITKHEVGKNIEQKFKTLEVMQGLSLMK